MRLTYPRVGRSVPILLLVATTLLTAALLTASTAWASKTQRFVDTTFADFQKGDTTTSTLTGQGVLTLPPRKTKAKVPDGIDVFWDAALAPDGRVFLGSGHEGKIVALDAENSGTLFATPPLKQVQALLLEDDGSLLAAGIPGKTIHRVHDADRVTTFATLDESYVWAMKRRPGGELYVATGPKGKIHKIDDEGTPSLFAEIKQAKNILGLDFDARGRLLAVTENKGMLVRFDADGEAFVLYESDLEEIRRVAVSRDGDIWLAINGEKSTGANEATGAAPGGGPGAAEIAALIAAGGGPDGDTPAARLSTPARRPAAPGRGGPSRVVLLTPEGFVRLGWTPPESPIHDIALENGGERVFVAAGNGGGVYRLDRLGRSEKIASVREKGIVRLVRRQGGALLALTNTPAMAYWIDPARSTDGEFVSRVLDAENPVRWGRAFLMAQTPDGTSVLFSTRSGNTGDPEHHWNDWTDEVAYLEGETLRIQSPATRRLQYRLRLKAASDEEAHWPKVERVEVPFVVPNQPPEIKEVTVTPEFRPASGPGGGARPAVPGIRPGGPGDGPGGARPASGPGGPGARRGDGAPETVSVEADSNAGKMTVAWKAEDPNDDELRFKVFIRPEEAKSWVLLDDEIEGNQYSIDSKALPDGRYRVRVVATDAPGNLPDHAMTAETVSDPFEVDNTPPALLDLTSAPGVGRSVVVTFRALDATTRIASAQWRLNGREWRFLAPADGLFDAREKAFVFHIPHVEFKSETTAMVSVRATDERGNTGVALIRVERDR